MRILFDQGTPRPLRRYLTGHEVRTSAQMGWSELGNGDLLVQAEGEFDLLLTTDKNIRHQQTLRGKRLAVLVLPSPNWKKIQPNADKVLAAVEAIQPGDYRELRA